MTGAGRVREVSSVRAYSAVAIDRSDQIRGDFRGSRNYIQQDSGLGAVHAYFHLHADN